MKFFRTSFKSAGCERGQYPCGGAGKRLLLVNPTVLTKREHLHIGITTVGSYVKMHSRHDVKILDFMTCRHFWKRKLAKTISEYNPDLIGIYLSSPYFPASRQVIAEIKKHASCPLVAGGHHATLAPDEVMNVPGTDMIIRGEAEESMLRLLDALCSGGIFKRESLNEVPGLWWKEGGLIHKNPVGEPLRADMIPPNIWSLHDEETLKAGFYFWGILPVMASRGCPGKCSFCSIRDIQRLYGDHCFLRYRDPVAVVDEMESDYEKYRSHGLRFAYFYDLNFLINKQWLSKFTDEYRKRGMNIKLKWSAYSRPDHVSSEALEYLKDSGCINLRIGFESADSYMRNTVYRKNICHEQMMDCVKKLKDAGITVTGYFMAGGPGERPEYLLKSLDFAFEQGVDFPVFFLYQPLAGSEALEEAHLHGSEKIPENDIVASDFLHGVSMRHKYLSSSQLLLFVFYTQLLFGSKIVGKQILRNTSIFRVPGSTLSWLSSLAIYTAKGIAAGFTPYGAFTCYTYYGRDHLNNPVHSTPVSRPSHAYHASKKAFKILMKAAGKLRDK